MKRALILAAGKGKRLGDLTKDKPKCLLNVSQDKTILDYSLDAISGTGIKEIIIVSGFASDILKEHITKKWASKFVFKIIYNPKFSEYNNIYSAYLARNEWNDETVLFNSDIIFDPSILHVIARSAATKQSQTLIDGDCHASFRSARNDIEKRSFLVIDNTKDLIEEDMKVLVDENRTIKRIHKSLDCKKSFGEYIGIMYLRGKEREKFLESLELNVKNKNLDLYYEDALEQILESISIYPCSTEGKEWTEVDTKEDLEKAKIIANKLQALAI